MSTAPLRIKSEIVDLIQLSLSSCVLYRGLFIAILYQSLDCTVTYCSLRRCLFMMWCVVYIVPIYITEPIGPPEGFQRPLGDLAVSSGAYQTINMFQQIQADI